MLNRDEADALEQTIESLLDLPVSKKYRERMRHAIRGAGQAAQGRTGVGEGEGAMSDKPKCDHNFRQHPRRSAWICSRCGFVRVNKPLTTRTPDDPTDAPPDAPPVNDPEAV